MVGQWLRVARQDPGRRPAAMTYVLFILVAQAGWVALAFATPSVAPMFVFAAALIAVEIAGPTVAELRHGGTPWHPHHIAERYGLLVIIALGEAILGTIAAIGAIVGPEGEGWSVAAAVVGVAGVTLTFGVWWTYFIVPSGELLAAHRERRFAWGYGHIPVFAGLVAISVVVMAVAVAMAAADVSFEWCLLVLSLAPWVTVVGYELRGHEHHLAVLEST